MKTCKNLIFIILLVIASLSPIITYADMLTMNDVALTQQTITAINYNTLAQCYTFTTTSKDNTKSFTWLLLDAEQTEETTKELTDKYLNKNIQILYSTTDNQIFRANDIIDWRIIE